MRIAILGVPHTITHPEWSACAFQSKALKMIKMMSGRGHEIHHLGHEDSKIHNAHDVHHHTVINNSAHRQAYGDDYVDSKAWKVHGFAKYFKADDYAHKVFAENSIKVLNELMSQSNEHIIVCMTWGYGHKAIYDHFGGDSHRQLIFVESGIGYGGAFARWRVFESHAIRNAIGGLNSINQCTQDNYHVVIPNYFDPEDFKYQIAKQDYILYLGRVYTGKGVDIAIDATRKANKRLVVAGQGTLKEMGYDMSHPDMKHVTEVGYADPQLRMKLMSNAQALFIASKYGEPFAGVQVESWLSGTPTITPDYAAFAELNIDGVTGYRCRTFKDYVDACHNVSNLKPVNCRDHGYKFVLGNVAPQYERYFQDVLNVYTKQGWYTYE
jgi:glycosyltransferase involved in cell wall biosynthesis